MDKINRNQNIMGLNYRFFYPFHLEKSLITHLSSDGFGFSVIKPLRELLTWQHFSIPSMTNGSLLFFRHQIQLQQLRRFRIRTLLITLNDHSMWRIFSLSIRNAPEHRAQYYHFIMSAQSIESICMLQLRA